MPSEPAPDKALDEKNMAESPPSPSTQLSDHEKAIIDRQLQVPEPKVGYFSLYRYANRKEILIMIVSTIASIVAGAILPLMTLVYGNFAGTFTSYTVDPVAKENFKHQTITFTLYFIYLGIASFVSVYIGIIGFSYTGERIAQQIRELYLRAIFRQNIAFFDFLGSGEVTTRISADMTLVQDGVGQKVSLFVTGCSMFVAALVVGFIRSWKLTLIMLSASVAILFSMGFHGAIMKKSQTEAVNIYASAGSLAEEVLSSARNVTAYGTQRRLQKKYNDVITEASKFDYKAKFFMSSMIAALMAVMNLQYGLGFWQGNRFFHAGELGIGQILTVMLSTMMAGISVAHNLPHLQAFGQATAAATKIFHTIERKSPIDPESDDGKKPDIIDGDIEFKNVRLAYPSRPDTTILHDFSLKIPAGKMLALVGASGSGKSTIFGLLERFYLPLGGQILLGENEISTLNLKWLRRHISIVSQEPVLFSTTIYESIAHGLVGTEYEHAKEEVRTELIENAAKIANAYDFIEELPDKFQTKVGERGGLLSGGQKQRIAIARAVVSDPKILLLDEATAALDTRSESAVQEALDRASEGRTTIVIAHRLSTIRDADMIVVMTQGRVVEQGTHNELLHKHGVYHSLVQAQELSQKMLPEGSKALEKDGAMTDEKLQLLKTTTSGAQSIKAAKRSEDEKYGTWDLVKFAWQMNEQEHKMIYIGFALCILAGFGSPIQAIFMGNSVIGLPAPWMTTGGHSINFWCLMFLMLGISTWIFYFLQGFTLAKASALLIARIRERAFAAVLRQDIEFFDQDEVTSGSLAAFLSTEANRLAGMSGATLGSIMTSAATVFGAIAVGCSFGWKLALVCVSTVPVVLGCGFFRFRALTAMEKRTKKSDTAASFACEAATSIRTVATLGLESHLHEQYHEKLNSQAMKNLRWTNASALLYAASQSLTMFCLALVFWYGGQLISSGEYTVLNFFICYAAIVLGSQSAGAIFSFAPDMGEARSAARVLKSFINRVPKIDSWSEEGKKIDHLDGKVELQDIRFTYPARPDHRILRGVNLKANPGQFVALVGASGSGKSTIMQLLERFYDPTSGSILIDDMELRDYHLQSYRSQLAIVSQETTLYTGTIRENILADKDDVSDAEVQQACEDANIWEFIQSLPEGLNTLVGAKGALLSGGQRQRLAIARALLRNPKVLLLDEATSALDSTSESVVQAALDKAAKGRTTIAIAHRLSTVQHADVIYVFDKGKVVEQGRHEELMGRRGVYWELGRLQDMGATQ